MNACAFVIGISGIIMWTGRIDRRHTALYDWILPLTEENEDADIAE